MVEFLSYKDTDMHPDTLQLLGKDEVIVIVDDSPEIAIILEHYLSIQGYPVCITGDAKGLFQLLNTRNVALILLDIGLPDKDGTEILAEIAPKYPDLGIVMVTGSMDLQMALDCLRVGADDYLTKPINIDLVNHTIRQTLKKRRLAIDNRLFQKELEATSFRTQLLHQLNLKMNSVYLSTVELDSILHAILVGITSEEGLRFNRAFLALFDEQQNTLQGKLAIGPSCREDAARLWNTIKESNLKFDDIIDSIRNECLDADVEVNRIARSLTIPATEYDHILIRSCRERRSIMVTKGQSPGISVPENLLHILGEDTFIVVPLYSPSKSLGVIIADNFVTQKPIPEDEIRTLEIFASQASLAIEHSHLYQDMTAKINELEMVTQELENNKDLLLESERYSTLGYMSAQLVHAIRNPITSIGGTARLLTKRTDDVNILKFLNIMVQETAKLESTLEDLFSFVEENALQKTSQSLNDLLRKSVMIFYGTMKKARITYQLDLTIDDPHLYIDARKIRQVFLHLIRNAIEAMPEGGTLKVATMNERDYAIVSIKDTGMGISDTNLARVADPFFTTKTYGTGMGLTLVEQIIKLHGAAFSLQRSDNGGMIVTITFKKQEPESEIQEPGS
jgi:signal transduction histidine kinase/DNA-binding response OmpR family regulator